MAAVAKKCYYSNTSKIILLIFTLVDKEGRAIIKVGDYKECRKIQDIVERNSGRDNQPLKVSILPAYLVAHQLFAIKLCLWLENLFSKCSGK